MKTTALALTSVITWSVATHAAADTKQVSETAQVSAVQVSVTVTDKDGRPVEDLSPEDFIVKDNGAKQELLFATHVETGEPPVEPGSSAEPLRLARNFVILFDLTFNDLSSLQLARAASLKFVREELEPGDYVAVFAMDTFKGVSLLMNFCKDRAQIEDAITSLGGSESDAFVPDSAGMVRLTTTQLAQKTASGATTLGAGIQTNLVISDARVAQQLQRADALQYRGAIGSYLTGLQTLVRGIDVLQGRKTVMFFSKGFDTKALGGMTTQEAAKQAERFQNENWEQLDTTTGEVDSRNIDLLEQALKLLSASDCRVFCIDASGTSRQAGPSEAGSGIGTRASLDMIAAETGGEVFANTNDLDAVINKITGATASYYVLAYNAPSTRKGGYHKIEVDTTRSGIKLSHRKGYYEPKPYEQFSELERQVQIAQILATGKSPEGLVASSSATLFPPCREKQEGAQPSAGRCAVVIETPAETLRKLTADGGKDLEMFSFAVLPGRGEVRGYCHGMSKLKDPQKSPGARFADVMELMPGTYEIHSVVRSTKSGACATATSAVSVALSPGFAMAACFVSEKSQWEYTTSRRLAGSCSPLIFKGSPAPALAVPAVAPGGDLTLLVKVYDVALDSTGKPDLDIRWQIVTPEGVAVPLSSYKFLQGDWPSKTDYDMVFKLTLPPQLRHGPYQLRVAATDRIGKGSSATLLRLTVTGGA
ncbi:MAG: VWA domain-containing protein [Acidobacteriota bacterium]